jgi:hypothetical protein
MRVRFPLPAPLRHSHLFLAMKTTTILAVFFGSVLILRAGEQITDCRTASQSLQKAVKGKEIEEVLKLIEKEVARNPQCSCELIQSAIKGFNAKPAVVATMVDTAIAAAPDDMELIIKCALAAAPDAQAEILAIATKYGFTPTPLDFPGSFGKDPFGQYLQGQNMPAFVNSNPNTVTPVDP